MNESHRLPRGLPRNGVSRRGFLGLVGAAGAAVSGCSEPSGTLLGGGTVGAPNTEASLRDNIYTRLLGIRPHVGAHDNISRLGGNRMAPEVIRAMAEANDYFVDMHELGAAAGARIAELLGAEAALVCAGGFSAMILGAAACLTGTDEEKIAALPHPTWSKRDCIIQEAQRFSYDRAYRAAGMSNVYVRTRDELLARMDRNTAMLAGLALAERQRLFAPPLPKKRAAPPDELLVPPDDLIAIGKQRGVPVLIDMASDLPPWENLTRFFEAGADLVVISGGKAIAGPQSTGILAGRKDLIAAAALNASPNEGIGRGMKVGKEEIVALVVALERFIGQDRAALSDEWNARARWLANQLQGIPGLEVEYALNTAEYADVDLRWDEAVIPLTRDDFRQRMKEGDPRIEIGVVIMGSVGGTAWNATVRTRLLRGGEEVLVARRLRNMFEGVARG